MAIACSAVDAIKNRAIEAGLASLDSFKGCTEEEIDFLAQQFAVRLPQCYRDFLAVMGRSAGEFLVGTDYSFPKMLDFRRDAERLVQTGQSSFKLSSSHFVFIFHQGYTFLFFDCKNDPKDPPVLMFTEAENEPRKLSDSFSDWLVNAAAADISAYLELKS